MRKSRHGNYIPRYVCRECELEIDRERKRKARANLSADLLCLASVAADKGIPSQLIKECYEEWKREYGPTFPLYGRETVRHDISGSVRPLLSSTEIPHERILADSSGISKRSITRIINGDTEYVSEEVAEKLVIMGMNRPDLWYSLIYEHL